MVKFPWNKDFENLREIYSKYLQMWENVSLFA